MSEEYARERLVDKVGITRELRGATQAMWFILTTGEHPDVRYGWGLDTCIEQYDELDPVGRLGVRTAPTFVGIAIAFFVAQASLEMPTGLLWLPVAYLGLTWLLYTFYDPLAGLYLMVGDRTGPQEVSS